MQETAAGQLVGLAILDRTAGKLTNAFKVTVQALRDGTAKAKLEELLGSAAWLNLRSV